MKTSHEYFNDKDGNRSVEYLGRTDELNDVLKAILKTIRINDVGVLPHENRSSHRKKGQYFNYLPVRVSLKKIEKEYRIVHWCRDGK